MFWQYGIFCSILTGSIWGFFWQLIFTMLGILSLGMQLTLQTLPFLIVGAFAGLFYLYLQKKMTLKFHLISITMIVLVIYGITFGRGAQTFRLGGTCLFGPSE